MGFSLGLGPASAREAGRRGTPRPQVEAWPGDERVAMRFAAGEPGSLELMVRHFAEDLFPLAARLVGAERGEAILEDAFLRALAVRERYRGEPPLGEWLRGFVEESAKARSRLFSGTGSPSERDAAVAPPFALASRLVACLEEKQQGPGAAFRRLGFLSRRAKALAVGGIVVAGALLVWNRTPEPPPTEGQGAMAVFFDTSSVVKEAVTPPGKIPVATLHPAKGHNPGWRLASPAVGARIPSALTAIFRLDLDASGRVKGIRKLFSVPSVPPDDVEQLLRNLVFEPISGMPQAGAVDVRIVAE
jgi:hypothetical protein